VVVACQVSEKIVAVPRIPNSNSVTLTGRCPPRSSDWLFLGFKVLTQCSRTCRLADRLLPATPAPPLEDSTTLQQLASYLARKPHPALFGVLMTCTSHFPRRQGQSTTLNLTLVDLYHLSPAEQVIWDSDSYPFEASQAIWRTANKALRRRTGAPPLQAEEKKRKRKEQREKEAHCNGGVTKKRKAKSVLCPR
jgi:hypothetical protein